MDELIHTYTREQAISDGTLIDISSVAAEAGFILPVAVTSTLWHGYIEPPESVSDWQDSAGRLWDLLNCLRVKIRSCSRQKARIDFEVIFQMSPNSAEKVTLKADCGPGDDAEPVVTIMLPGED